MPAPRRPLKTELPERLFTCGWRVCPTCPTEDNVWPETSFYAGMGPCKACYEQAYAAVRRGRRRDRRREAAQREARTA